GVMQVGRGGAVYGREEVEEEWGLGLEMVWWGEVVGWGVEGVGRVVGRGGGGEWRSKGGEGTVN
uniref:hypothetical protein n=1 Tax=Kocuria salsicia TaxID=664639 RepID=UPI001C92FD19